MVIGSPSYYKRGDGRWTGQVKVRTGAKTTTKYIYGNQRKIVVEKTNAFIAEHKALMSRNDMLYGDFLKKWLKYKRLDLKSTSYDRIEGIVRNQIVPALGDYMICGILSEDITDFLSDIKVKYSFSTFKKCYECLNSSFEYACETEVLDRSPMSGMKKPKRDDKVEDDAKCFTDAELRKFKETAFKQYKNGKYKYASRWEYIFMLNTGLRLGEMLALQYKDINLNTKKVRVNKNLVAIDKRDKDGKKLIGKELKLQTPKGGRTRYVPLNPIAIEAITEIKKQTYVNDESLVIQDKNGKHLNSRSYTKRFYTVLKDAELEKTGLHILRHQFATTMFHKGLDIKVISLYLGHKDVATTEKIYVHLVNERKELQKLDICV